jgi:hypothetical protein
MTVKVGLPIHRGSRRRMKCQRSNPGSTTGVADENDEYGTVKSVANDGSLTKATSEWALSGNLTTTEI